MLVITPRTVEAHLTRIHAKLRLRSRAEPVAHSAGVSAIPSRGPNRSTCSPFRTDETEGETQR